MSFTFSRMTRYAVTSAVLLFAAHAPAAQQPGSSQMTPDALVKSTSEEVLATIKHTNDRQKLMQLAEAKVAPHFDFDRMTRLAVGRAWQQATPEQRQRLEQEFRDLLVRTYTNAVAAGAHSKASISYKPFHASSGSDEAVVKTQVVEPGKPPIEIDYSMENGSGGWKVYDVTVDNISLVTNYRDSFASSVSRGGIDALISDLAEKNKSNKSGGSSGK